MGHFVKGGKIKSLDEIYQLSLPIKEHEIINMFIGPAVKDMHVEGHKMAVQGDGEQSVGFVNAVEDVHEKVHKATVQGDGKDVITGVSGSCDKKKLLGLAKAVAVEGRPGGW